MRVGRHIKFCKPILGHFPWVDPPGVLYQNTRLKVTFVATERFKQLAETPCIKNQRTI